MRNLFHHMQDLWSRASAIGRQFAMTVRGPVLWLTVCGGVLVATIFVGTIIMAGEFRERAIASSERELKNTVLLLSRHFDQQFEDSDTIAADVISRLQISGIGSDREFKERIASTEAHEILRAKAGVLSYLGEISIFDSNGDMINWSRPLPQTRPRAGAATAPCWAHPQNWPRSCWPPADRPAARSRPAARRKSARSCR